MITNLRSTARNFTAMKIPRTHLRDLEFVLIIERYRHAGCDCIISILFVLKMITRYVKKLNIIKVITICRILSCVIIQESLKFSKTLNYYPFSVLF